MYCVKSSQINISYYDVIYELGSQNNNLEWIVYDFYPQSYSVFLDNSIVFTGNWENNQPVSIDINNLPVGSYNYTLRVEDGFANWDSDQIIVEVVDSTIPSISSPQDLDYELGTVDNNIIWQISDLDPKEYYILLDETEILRENWQLEENFSLNVDNLVLGVYNYTLVVVDQSGNLNFDDVILSVIDFSNPILSHPNDMVLELGTININIEWQASDLDPEEFYIYRNNTLISNGIFISDVSISTSLNGLSIGIHNFTILVTDTSGNSASDLVWVTIIDTTSPDLDSPGDIILELGDNSKNIIWNASDHDPKNYVIYQNDVWIIQSYWASPASFNLYFIDLDIGEYNFSIVLFDYSGNWMKDDVQVIVQDTTDPLISQPDDIILEYGDNSKSISWQASDLDPDWFYIYENEVLVFDNPWITTVDIKTYLNGLDVGTYNYTIVVNDKSGNSETDLVWVIVEDTTAPTLTTSPDFSYEHGSMNNELSWEANDLNPSTYVIYLNDTEIVSGIWINDQTYFMDVNGLDLGLYNYTIVVTDIYANYILESVFVTVIDTTNPTVNQPGDIVYQSGEAGFDISWNASDNNPDAYIIYLDEVETENSNWISYIFITFNVDGLEVGTHNVSIVIFDTSGNSAMDTVIVEVTEPPITTDTTTSQDPSSTSPTTTNGFSLVLLLFSIIGLVIFKNRRKWIN